MNLTPDHIHTKLSTAFDPHQSPESPYPNSLNNQPKQTAAVLIPFLEKETAWHLLFIRRTYHKNDRHGGQVAYPGGRCDPGEQDAETAALREASEEVGIKPSDVKILGKLRDMLTISNYRVTPIVGMIPWPYPLVPQPEEVSRIFTIPLRWLADPANREVQNRDVQFQGDPIPVIYFKPYDGETLWGASARITLLLLEAVGLSDPSARYKNKF
jgi:8-oxo-dGTP pyrophosphatase MutT (NUDIX family)